MNIKVFIRYYSALVYGFNIAAALVVLLMALCITVNVLMRKLFNYDLGWVFDFSQYALVYITFLSAPWLTRQDGHIRVDLVLLVVPKRFGFLVDAACFVFCSVVCVALLH